MRIPNRWMLLWLAGCLFLHMGVIRKEFDPIKNTQTDSISYKQKQEELKDGEKGPPTPSFKFYKRADFQAKDPMEIHAEHDAMKGREEDSYAGYNEASPQETPAAEERSGGEDWWSESDEEKDPEKPTVTGPEGGPVWEERW